MPPRCSLDAHSPGILPRRVFGEQRGGAAKILSRNGVEHAERTQSTHPRAVRGNRWTIRMSYGDKYATECIFIDATLSDVGRILVTRLSMKMKSTDMIKRA